MVEKEYLKVAMLGHKRIPSREGGIEIVVEELSTRMVKLGHKVTCFNRSGHHVSGKEYDGNNIDEYKGVKLKEVFTIDKKGLAAVTASIFATIKVAFGKYDIVHFHAEGSCAMLWLPKLMGKKCIATIHGLDHQRAKWGKFASAYIMIGEKCAVKYANEIIVLGDNAKCYFKETYDRETHFIPNGVNSPKIQNADIITKQYGLEKNNYFLFLARLVPEKGAQYLIEAFKRVKMDKKLVIAGGASDTDEFMIQLKQLAQGDDRIIFTGFVQGQLLDELYSNAFVYVLPSDLEGMPLSLLEAMSYGNCCIVSDIPECIDIINEKAIVFKKGNIDDLTKKLLLVNNDENMVADFRINSSDFICQKYNWDNVVESTIELYRESLKQ